MVEQPEALRLAERIEQMMSEGWATQSEADAAAELRRLYQSEREGWRYAADLEQERKRLQDVELAYSRLMDKHNALHINHAQLKIARLNLEAEMRRLQKLLKPLAWEQINEMWIVACNNRSRLPTHVVYARAIEAAHGITAANPISQRNPASVQQYVPTEADLATQALELPPVKTYHRGRPQFCGRFDDHRQDEYRTGLDAVDQPEEN